MPANSGLPDTPQRIAVVCAADRRCLRLREEACRQREAVRETAEMSVVWPGRCCPTCAGGHRSHPDEHNVGTSYSVGTSCKGRAIGG
jgi:hypothetical protein